MSNQQRAIPGRCLFFGMPGVFSRRILEALDHPKVKVVGIVNRSILTVEDPIRVVPARAQRSVPGFATSSSMNAPRFLVHSLSSTTVQRALVATEPDLIVVGCFPLRVPETLLKAAKIGAVNIHPSLLPRHRGPDPLFWTFHAGDTEAGVSIHRLTAEFDDGSIISQNSTSIPINTPLPDLDATLADMGAGLLRRLLDDLPELPAGTAQIDSATTYESFPKLADLVITGDWMVDRATRFINGVGQSHGPLSYVSRDFGVISFRELGSSARSVEIVLRDGSIRVKPLASDVLTTTDKL